MQRLAVTYLVVVIVSPFATAEGLGSESPPRAVRQGDRSDARKGADENPLNGFYDFMDAVNRPERPSVSNARLGQQRGLLQQLPPFTRIAGDTTLAPAFDGNPNPSCDPLSGCINGCRSLFYTVAGTGRDMVASTCDEDNYQSAIYVWEGDRPVSFQCANVAMWDWCNGDDDTSARVLWGSKRGVRYRVQVTGVNPTEYGQFILTVVGTTDPLVPFSTELAPTLPPAEVPTGVPSALATQSPTEAPSAPPSPPPPPPPTKVPTRAPTVPTAGPCPGGATVTPKFRVYNATTNKPSRRLFNNTATCLSHPYNVEIRPCGSSTLSLALPVRFLLVEVSTGTVVHRSSARLQSPFFLFGPPVRMGGGDLVASSPQPLPNGSYRLSVKGSPGWGRLTFEQRCP